MPHDTPRIYDVIIVGGGPAGLSAALLLGRCRRTVLVCDSNQPRNAASRAVHGFLTRDGCPPSELRRIGHEQLATYGVPVRSVEVTGVERQDNGFAVTLHGDREPLLCRKLLLATGVVDFVPDVEGFQAFYGRGVHHCPYCDAWELRDQPLAAYGHDELGIGLARSLKTWSDEVVLCTDGHSRISAKNREALEIDAIPVRTERIARLEGDASLQRVVFETGESIACRGMFFSTGQVLRSPLAVRLGCRTTRRGVVRTGRLEETGVPGLYVAGDASRDVQFVVVAAAEGAKAAVAINRALQVEEQQARVAARATLTTPAG